MKYIIGCDPDTKASGIAIYVDGKLQFLECMSLIDVYRQFASIKTLGVDCELHIEDLHSQKGVWHEGGNGAARNVGRCEQIQLEIEKIAEHFGIKVFRHKVSSKWKSQAGKKEFELVTGWKGRCGEDARSAAWFGFLGAGKTT